MNRFFPTLAGGLALAGCATTTAHKPAPQVTSEPEETGWKAIVSAADEARLAALPEIWGQALGALSRNEERARLKEGALLDPAAMREHPAVPPGSYQCRVIKLGETGSRLPALRSFPPFFCYVRAESGGRLSFTKQTGTELPGGWLHADDDRRMIFTGALQHLAGDNSLAYGAEPDRDLVGVIERIGPFQWRLVLPWHGPKPGLDIYELTPVPLDRQPSEPQPAVEPAPATNHQ